MSQEINGCYNCSGLSPVGDSFPLLGSLDDGMGVRVEVVVMGWMGLVGS